MNYLNVEGKIGTSRTLKKAIFSFFDLQNLAVPLNNSLKTPKNAQSTPFWCLSFIWVSELQKYCKFWHKWPHKNFHLRAMCCYLWHSKGTISTILYSSLVMCWAQLGLKPRAWAGLQRARACQNSSLTLSWGPGLAWAWLGLSPGLHPKRVIGWNNLVKFEYKLVCEKQPNCIVL